MCQWREIATCSDRSLFRNDRMDAAIEHFAKQFDDFETNAAEPQSQHIRAQQHHRAHFRFRKRLADPASVTANEVELKLAQFVVRNADVGELAESRVYSVDDNIARNNIIDHFARSQNPRSR